MYDFITVGSATLDVFVYTDLPELHKQNKDFIAYPAGSKLLIKDLRFEIGGGGTNTAVSFSRLGFNTAYLGSIGRDNSSIRVLELLKREGVNFIGNYSEKPTGYSLVLDSKEHERTILTFKGANNQLNFKKIDKAHLKTKWFYFSSMIAESFKTQKKLAEFASEKGIKIAYNPSEYQVKLRNQIMPIIKNTSILVFNLEEARIFLQDYKSGLRELLEKLHKIVPIVCITNGLDGAYFYNGFNLIKVYAHKIKVVEKTGAGDAFASTLVASLIKGFNVEDSLKLALLNSESIIQHIGPKNILLTWPELLKLNKKTKTIVKEIS